MTDAHPARKVPYKCSLERVSFRFENIEWKVLLLWQNLNWERNLKPSKDVSVSLIFWLFNFVINMNCKSRKIGGNEGGDSGNNNCS